MKSLRFIGLMLFAAAGVAVAQEIPAKPARYFNDYAGVVSPATARELNERLEQFERETSSQIVVAIYPKLEWRSDVADFANRTFRAWEVGQKDRNNGAVLFVFVQDRLMRIEVGYGLEGAIPDAIARRIIAEEIQPHFRAGNFDAGLRAGTTALMAAARGEYTGTGRTVAERNGRRAPGNPVIWIVLAIVLLSFFGRRRRRRGTFYGGFGRRHYSPWMWGGGSWRGGGGFGGGGGGFMGGGGSSGGGGASGRW